MKKWIILFLMVIMMANLVVSMDEELFNPLLGDEEIYSISRGDEELNEYFTSPTTPVVPVAPSGGGYGGSYLGPYYDIFIYGVNEVYNRGDIVNFNINIVNKGDTPDKDAVLYYSLIDSNNKSYGASLEVFEEVPPTFYSPSECKKFFHTMIDNETGHCITSLEKSIFIPNNSTKGGWNVYVEYKTEDPLITVYKGFTVESIWNTKVITLIVLALILLLIVPKKSWRRRE